MEDEIHVPDEILADIIKRVRGAADRNNLALVCKRWFEAERVLRTELKLAGGTHSAELAIHSITARFINLSKLHITYMGCASSLTRQVNDSTFQILATQCGQLRDLSLSYCAFITDVGLGHLTSCEKLECLRLNFLPGVSGRGLLSLASGCAKLRLLHLERLMRVRTVEWLDYLGKKGSIQSFSVKHCRCVGDYELAKLGSRGWKNLREFVFEVDMTHGVTGDFFGHNGREAALFSAWRIQDSTEECCPNLQVLSLTKTLSAAGTGLNWLLSQCSSLLHLHLDTCFGLGDEELLSLARRCSGLSSIYFKAPIHLPSPNRPRLTDAGVLAIARHASALETLELAFYERDFIPYFTTVGVLAIVENCPKLKSLTLNCALPFTDEVMAAVCRSKSIQVLELIQCQLVSDAGLRMVRHSNLVELKVRSCHQFTDAGFAPLRDTKQLKYLAVEDCPRVTREMVDHAAEVVLYDGLVNEHF